MFTRCVAMLLAALSICVAAAAEQKEERLAFQDNFESMAGWAKLELEGENAPLKEMKAENGMGIFITQPAPLHAVRDPKWSDGLPIIDEFSNVAKTYGEVDLDKYHYLVMKIAEKSCVACVILNDVDLPIAYTTGIRAVDLSTYKFEGLKGKQTVKVRIQFLNSGGSFKLNWLRLASELTPEEKKGLIPSDTCSSLKT